MIGQTPSFHQGLKLVSGCPLCETRYHMRQAKILDQYDDSQLVHITCSKCGVSVLAVISINQIGIISVGLVSDLTGREVLTFRDLEAISGDEVLDFHREINKTSLKELLGV